MTGLNVLLIFWLMLATLLKWFDSDWITDIHKKNKMEKAKQVETREESKLKDIVVSEFS